MGANLVAGVLLLVLGLLGVGERIMRWLPLPIIMGMFAGSILEYVIRMVKVAVEDVAVAGTVVGCYLLGRLIADPPLVGFIVAATPFSILGITSAFWEIIAGVAASLCVERKQRLAFWAGK